MGTQHYLDNPLIHADRRAKLRQSEWTEQFRCDHLKPLIICRGPIRKEALDVFAEMGINTYGILLSEKDSIVYRGALAPELASARLGTICGAPPCVFKPRPSSATCQP